MLNKFRTWLADVIRPATPVAPIVEPAPTAAPAPTVEVAQTVPVAPAAHAPVPEIDPEQLTIKHAKAPKARDVLRANDLIDAHEFSAISGLAISSLLNYNSVSKVKRDWAAAYSAFPTSVKRAVRGKRRCLWNKLDAVRWSEFYWSCGFDTKCMQDKMLEKSRYVDLKFVADIAGISYHTAYTRYRQKHADELRQNQRIRLHRSDALRLVLEYLEEKAAR